MSNLRSFFSMRRVTLAASLALFGSLFACGGAEPVGDGSQAVVQGEHGKRMHRGMRNPEALIKKFDKNGDGKLAVVELPEKLQKRLGKADANKDGVISVEEITAHRAKMRARFAEMRKMSAEDLFKKFDKNGDGKITVGEVPERMQKHFGKADTNQDGAISVEELKVVREKMHKRFAKMHKRHGFKFMKNPEALIKKFDQNGDGKLALVELPEKMQKRFGKADANGDGVISVEEIKAQREARHKARFLKKDKDGDGALNEIEVGQKRWGYLKAADANGDGKVTIDEIRAAKASGLLKHKGFRHHKQ